MAYLKGTISFVMKKYLLAGAVGLFTTAAVTATVLSTNNIDPKKKEVKKETKKKQCAKKRTDCFFS
jgi:hypothetical protein